MVHSFTADSCVVDDECYGNFENFNTVCSQCGWRDKCKKVTGLVKSDNIFDRAVADMEIATGPELGDD